MVDNFNFHFIVRENEQKLHSRIIHKNEFLFLHNFNIRRIVKMKEDEEAERFKNQCKVVLVFISILIRCQYS